MYLWSCQLAMMDFFCENSIFLLKSSIIDVWQDPEYSSEHVNYLSCQMFPAAGYSQRINATTQITEFLKF